MTKEQEAQQEQTLAEIRAIRNGGEYPREYYREAIDKALVLIHSQAQKIAEQAKEIEQARTIADEWREKAGSKYDPFPWETTDSKEVAR